jgi:serine O-acetyltransferase
MICTNIKGYNNTITKKEIDLFLFTLRNYLFPGYFEQVTGTVESYVCLKKYEAQCILESLMCKLKIEGACIKCFFEEVDKAGKILLTDIDAMFQGDPAAESIDEIILTYPGFYAIFVYRMAHILYLKHIDLLPRMMSENAHSQTGIDIHPGADIDEFFFIDHGTGIVIGETTKIGTHVKIYQGVTLGALSLAAGQNLKGIKRHPTIGSFVTIYSGASILGGDTIIGDHVTIGSNVFITDSIESDVKVIMKSPELIKINRK